MTITVRKAETQDTKILSVLATEVWLDTYAKDGILKAYADHLLTRYSPAAFRRYLECSATEVLVSCDADLILGYAKLTSGSSNVEQRFGPAEVATLYVRRHHARRGIGGRLLSEALRLATEAGHKSVYVSVYRENHAALAFYQAWGFREIGTKVAQLSNSEVELCILSVSTDRTCR
ncbi:GNAT family N-acetyltransferase [Rhizobium sp. HT1-10]|uniref:GNAT family N-acetyltransferase n=1 Tax=Rhizobium sp. HT1-10 TaxID=3111638 RepID=UPI003C23C8B2